MSRVAVFVTFTIVVMMMMMMKGFVSCLDEFKLPKMKSKGRNFFSSNNFKHSLRLRDLSGEETPIIKMYGYLEAVFYQNGDCTNAQAKKATALNICSLSADSTHEGSYLKGTVYAYPEYNYYEINIQFFSDSACTSLLSTETFSLLILICNDNELDHVIAEPLNPVEDNLDFSLLLYDSATNCVNNNYQVGVTEAIYGRFGTCIQADDPSNGDVDTMFVSCSSSQLVVNAYSSTDGSCTGIITPQTLVTADFCQSGEDTILDNYYGYLTFGCAIHSS